MMRWFQQLTLSALPVSWLRHRLMDHTHTKTNTTPRQLLIDVSALAQSDAKTGIQRVVRNLYQQLLLAPPEGYQVCPVMATRKQFYRHIPTDFLQQVSATFTTNPILIRDGDIFLGLDLSAHLIPHHLPELWAWKKQGVHMTFVIYDLLPVLHPQWFNPKATQNFLKWLRALAWLADGVAGISRTVQADFTHWMQRYGLNESDIPCAIIPLGAELDAIPSEDKISTIYSSTNSNESPYILMVGTLEPRKGYDDALAAFEALWATGNTTRLIIVGKQGWKIEPLVHQLQTHIELGKRLVWLNQVDDIQLCSLYQQCQGVLMASKAEGYGLPLIEAIHFNKPVLARDIRVFRDIAGEKISYFNTSEVDTLAHAVMLWLQHISNSQLSYPTSSTPTWHEAKSELLQSMGLRYSLRKGS